MMDINKYEKLSEFIFDLKVETGKIHCNPLLEEFDCEQIRYLEKIAMDDKDFAWKLSEMRRQLNRSNFDSGLEYAHAIYRELIAFLEIRKRLQIKFVDVKQTKTPDFFLKDIVPVEMKTLHFSSGNKNYLKVIRESAEAKAEAKLSFQQSSSWTISPFFNPNAPLSHYKSSVLIETLIRKFSAYLDRDKINFEGNDGILLIDVSHTLKLLPEHLGVPVCLFPAPPPYLLSGFIWNAFYARTGDPTYEFNEFGCKPNIGDRLSVDGIFQNSRYNFLKAVAFICANREYIGFYRTGYYSTSVVECLHLICDHVNDEWNMKMVGFKTRKSG